MNHVKRRVAHRGHGDGRDQERDGTADQQPHQDPGAGQFELEIRVMDPHRGHEGGDDGQRGQRRGADRKALADGGRGIAERIQGIRDFTGLRPQAGHFGDAAGIVRHRAIGVDRHGNAHGGQHAHRRDTHAIDARELRGDEDHRCQDQDRQHHGLHAHRKAGDHHGGRAGIAGIGDLAHRSAAGVILGDQAHQGAAHGAGEHREPDTQLDPQPAHQKPGRHHEQGGGGKGSGTQGPARLGAGTQAHHPDADHRGQQSHGCQRQRQEHQRGLRPMSGHGCGNGDRGDHGAAVGLENVGSHAGNITDVVPDIVGDHARIAGVVFGNAGLDLAHQVCAHVRALGVDAAAYPGEQRHRGGPHAEPVDGVHRFGITTQIGIEQPQAQQSQRRDAESHDGTAVKGHGKRGGGAFAVRGSGGADIGPGRRVHPQPAGAGRTQGADQKRQRGMQTQGREQDDGQQHRREHPQHCVLAAHEHHGAEVDLVGDPGHLGVSGGPLENQPVEHQRDDQAEHPDHGRQIEHVDHDFPSRLLLLSQYPHSRRPF